MRLDDRYVPYLQMAGLYHLARLNDRWFRLDEALDVAYQLGLPVERRYVSGCLSEFHIYIEGGRPAWVWFQELLEVIPPPSQVQKYAVNCTWFQETFGECPEDADEDTVCRYARAYIMMLLGTQLFADKSGNRIHIRWLPYVVRLEELGTYSWGSAALAWLYRPAGYETFSWPLASRWSGYNPSGSEKGPRVQMWRLRIDRLQDREFIWMPYSSPDVLQVVHPEVLEPRHMALWRSVTTLIYFAVIEWHQIDRVLPQFGGWHLHWDSHQESVLRFDVVADPGPSHEFLEWWSQHEKRFLSLDPQLGDPRAVSIPVEASQRGPGRVPDMDRPEYVPDRRRVERRMGVGTRRSQREWRWPDHAMDDDYDAGPVRGGRRVQGGRARGRADRGDDNEDQHGHVGGGGSGAIAAAGTSTHDGGHGGEWYGTGMGDGADTGDAGLGSGPLGHYFVGVPADDQPEQGGTPWVIPGSQWSDFIGSDTLVGDFGSPRFLEEITAIMQGDMTPRSDGQTSSTQAPLDVDLNEPPSSSAGHQFCLGGTPPSAFTAASESVAGPSAAPLHVAPPAQPAPQEDGDDIEDEEPFFRLGQRARVARRCGTGSHLFR
ncbi:uncharacterized protein DS421_19g659090 [Arachis hypogaea]|uniref:Aminotransferase-like plant mobile domain-containing protein n=1 Tax=Arachis hypogaea TaxID=3818 RepID=A0A6B9VBU3_ARAHY|nr:uncharacterized protein DS421_19g659090 [Arachis hypogaea]